MASSGLKPVFVHLNTSYISEETELFKYFCHRKSDEQLIKADTEGSPNQTDNSFKIPKGLFLGLC